MALSLATNHGSQQGCALSARDAFVAVGEARKHEANKRQQASEKCNGFVKDLVSRQRLSLTYRTSQILWGESEYQRALQEPPFLTGDLFMTFKKGWGGGRGQPGGIQNGSSFASRGNPSHARGEDGVEKNLDSCRLAWKSLPFCRDCAAPLFVTEARIPTSAPRSSRLQKKKKNLKSSERRRRGEKFCIKALKIGPSTFSRSGEKRGEVGSCCADRKILN